MTDDLRREVVRQRHVLREIDLKLSPLGTATEDLVRSQLAKEEKPFKKESQPLTPELVDALANLINAYPAKTWPKFIYLGRRRAILGGDLKASVLSSRARLVIEEITTGRS